MRRVLVLLSATAVLFSCAEKKPVATPKPPSEDRQIEAVLKKIAQKVDRLEKLDRPQTQFLHDVPSVKKKEGKSGRPVKPEVSKKKTGKTGEKTERKKKKVKLYSYVGREVAFGSAIGYLFAEDYSIVFDEEVNLSKPVTVMIRKMKAEDACREISRRAGYWCEINKKRKLVRILHQKEVVISLPAGIEELTYEATLGGDVFRGGSSSGGSGGITGIPSQTSLSSGGIKSGGKVQLKESRQRKEFEDFIKSFLSEEGEVKIEWNSKTLYVRDRVDRVEAVERAVEKLKKKLSKSVFIEARLLLVSTDRSLETGVQWQKLMKLSSGTLTASLTAGVTAPAFTLQYSGNTLSGIIQLLSETGDVRELISQKIRTTNLHPAVFVRGTNEPYVVFSPVSTSTGSGVVTQTNTTVQYAFNGISFFVKPYVLNREIYLTLEPSISTVGDYLTFTDSSGNTIKIPRTSITSQITKLKTKDNTTIVMGGLVWDGKKKTTTGVPLFDSLPLIGRLFKADVDKKSKIYVLLTIYTKVDGGQK